MSKLTNLDLRLELENVHFADVNLSLLKRVVNYSLIVLDLFIRLVQLQDFFHQDAIQIRCLL